MTKDRYRNTTWDESVEKAFESKLRRARDKEQYLRIQACTLANSHPQIALNLLDRYFELPDRVDEAQAHVDRATALLALDRVDDAISSYEAALAREKEFPNLLTEAYIELPYLIAASGIREKYSRALQLLNLNKEHLTFPVDHFRWHAAYALIAADLKDDQAARINAEKALEWSDRKQSGFRYHSSVGLVTDKYENVIGRLRTYGAD